MFSNAFGLTWLIILTLASGALLVFLFIKKEKVVEVIEEKRELLKETYNSYLIEEREDGVFEVKKEDGKVEKSFDNFNDCKIFIDVLNLRSESDSNYEIFEEDNFFKVRNKGSTRTLRKFTEREEAENYIKEKENND